MNEKSLRDFIKEKNKEGRKLRLHENPNFGEWKMVGGKDKNEYFLTGKDIKDRRVNIAGSEKFIRKEFEEGWL